MAKDVKNKKHFMKDFKAELKKVIWPTPKQVVNNTIAVITIVLITAAIVFVLDLTFDLLNNVGINRLKNHFGNSQTEITQNTANTNIVNNETVDNTVTNNLTENQ